MIKISNRLEAITKYIVDGDKIIDVGCDHALLDIYLATKLENIKIIASDVLASALKQAKNNIEKYDQQNKIEVRLSDGIDSLKENEVNTIVIAGMGYQRIIEILNKNKYKLNNIEKLIIQSNNHVDLVRKKICDLGFYIDDEKFILEKQIIYIIICFKRGKRKYSKSDFLLGPVLKNSDDALYYGYIKQKVVKNQEIIRKLPSHYFLKKAKVLHENVIYKKVLNNNQVK